MRRRIAAVTTALVSAAGLALTGGAPALAAPDRGTTNHCWVDGVTQESLCVEPGADLVAEVLRQKGVQIAAPEGTTIGGKPFRAAEYGAADARSGVVAQAAYVVSIVYDNINYGGGSAIITGVSTGCSSYAYGYTSLGAIGWSGRVSSFRSFLNCRTAVFDDENYGGSAYGYVSNASQLGSMNDRADSWRVAR
ncbi:hypothetical protein [Agromyces sp. NPDC049794]|uniref:hypothetical protein n=1 Tax=unclassified Agromyces TaxID=2639701 RepID=UPI0033D596C4